MNLEINTPVNFIQLGQNWKLPKSVEIMKEEFVEEESVEEARETEQSEQSEPIEKPKAVRRKRSK